jgi:hypothetical protein
MGRASVQTDPHRGEGWYLVLHQEAHPNAPRTLLWTGKDKKAAAQYAVRHNAIDRKRKGGT